MRFLGKQKYEAGQYESNLKDEYEENADSVVSDLQKDIRYWNETLEKENKSKQLE